MFGINLSTINKKQELQLLKTTFHLKVNFMSLLERYISKAPATSFIGSNVKSIQHLLLAL